MAELVPGALLRRHLFKAHRAVEIVALAVIPGHKGKGVVIALRLQKRQQRAVQPPADALTDAVGRTVDRRLDIP